MSGCHVPLVEDEILYKMNELYNLLKLYLKQKDLINLPHHICGHCNGIGKIVDDGIL